MLPAVRAVASAAVRISYSDCKSFVYYIQSSQKHETPSLLKVRTNGKAAGSQSMENTRLSTFSLAHLRFPSGGSATRQRVYTLANLRLGRKHRRAIRHRLHVARPFPARIARPEQAGCEPALTVAKQQIQ